jgi:hypothetical protein
MGRLMAFPFNAGTETADRFGEDSINAQTWLEASA